MRKKTSSKKRVYSLLLLAGVFGGIFVELLMTPAVNDYNLLFLGFFWIVAAKLNRIRPATSFGLALSIIVVCPFFVIFHSETIGQKLAIWAYVFLLTGIAQKTLETIKNQ